ncbi:MAG: hypothetical protein GXO82_09690, partial [Chlorobi bacterium]|nr:hypothetical protein [Chlorobiota bacterium]
NNVGLNVHTLEDNDVHPHIQPAVILVIAVEYKVASTAGGHVVRQRLEKQPPTVIKPDTYLGDGGREMPPNDGDVLMTVSIGRKGIWFER